MARTKSITTKRHNKVKKMAKGFKHARRKRVKVAKEALLHQGQYAYVGRKLKKRDLRKTWITRLNAAARENGTTYSKLIKALADKKVEVDRKILSDIAATDPKTFEEIVKAVK